MSFLDCIRNSYGDYYEKTHNDGVLLNYKVGIKPRKSSISFGEYIYTNNHYANKYYKQIKNRIGFEVMCFFCLLNVTIVI